jgi:hypothetical protein
MNPKDTYAYSNICRNPVHYFLRNWIHVTGDGRCNYVIIGVSASITTQKTLRKISICSLVESSVHAAAKYNKYLYFYLFSYVVKNWWHTASHDCMIVNYMDVTVAHFKSRFERLPGRNEKDHKRSVSGYSVPRLDLFRVATIWYDLVSNSYRDNSTIEVCISCNCHCFVIR